MNTKIIIYHPLFSEDLGTNEKTAQESALIALKINEFLENHSIACVGFNFLGNFSIALFIPYDPISNKAYTYDEYSINDNIESEVLRMLRFHKEFLKSGILGQGNWPYHCKKCKVNFIDHRYKTPVFCPVCLNCSNVFDDLIDDHDYNDPDLYPEIIELSYSNEDEEDDYHDPFYCEEE